MHHLEPNLAYKTGTPYEAERCIIDLYTPEKEIKAWLLWFHGGGLTGGDKSESVPLATWLADRGIGVALAHYRLNPHVQYPAYLEDALAALQWLHGYLAESAQGSQNVFIGGHSAGGYLAALLALKPLEGKPPIAGVIPMSGQMTTHFTVRAERGIGPNQVTADEAAPIFHVCAEAPPFCVLISDNDIPGRLEENAYFAAMMKVSGHTATEFHIIADREHGSISERFGEPGDEVSAVVLRFIMQSRS